MATADPEIISSTKFALNKVISKPAATDKLLQRPPFKFIQDVILSIIETTGFMKDLYTAEESSADSAKNREAKIAFLQKAIDYLEQTTGEKLNIKASKVVAGLEVDNTNIFLTKLAQAADGKTDSIGSTGESTVSKKVNPDKPVRSSSRKKDATSEDNATRKLSPAPKVAPNSKSSTSSVNSSNSKSKVKKKESPAADSSKKISTDTSSKNKSGEAITATEDNANSVPELTVRPPTAASSNQRPTTARAPPPRVTKKLDADDAITVMAAQEEQIRLKSGKGIKSLIVENDSSGQISTTAADDDQLFVVDDGSNQFDDENAPNLDFKRGDNDDQAKGSLTKQLADARTQLTTHPSQIPTEDENQLQRSAIAFNEEKLRNNLQKLTRITNPFGRLLDALQEDVDFMFTEYKSWLDEYKRNSALLESDINSKDQSLEKLQLQIDEVDKSINEKLDQIASIKSSIEMTDNKLRRMISLAVSKNR